VIPERGRRAPVPSGHGWDTAAVLPPRGPGATGRRPPPPRRRRGGTARRVLGWVAVLVVAAAGVAGVRALAPDRPALGRGFLLLVAVAVIARLAGSARTGEPGADRSAYDRAARTGEGDPPVPDDLRRLEQTLWFASARQADLHHRLRPVLREIAELRLAARGIDLDGDEAGARAVLGEELWEVVRPDRPAPTDPTAPGPPPESLHALVDRLEAV
jgi:hypothetical protein